MKSTLLNITTCLLLLFITQVLFAQTTNVTTRQQFTEQEIKELKKVHHINMDNLTEQEIKELKKVHHINIRMLEQDINGLKQIDSVFDIELKRLKKGFLIKVDTLFNIELKKLTADFLTKTSALQDSITKLNIKLQNTNNTLQSLILRVAAIENNTNQRQKTPDESTGKSNLYWIAIIMPTALLSVLLFYWLRKKVNQK